MSEPVSGRAPEDDFTQHSVPLRQLRLWESRAVTLQIKAADLLDSMINAAGVDHPVVDRADSLTAEADALRSLIERMIDAKRGQS